MTLDEKDELTRRDEENRQLLAIHAGAVAVACGAIYECNNELLGKMIDSIRVYVTAYSGIVTDDTAIIDLLATVVDDYVTSSKSNDDIRGELKTVANLLATKALAEWCHSGRDGTGRDGTGRDGTGRDEEEKQLLSIHDGAIAIATRCICESDEDAQIVNLIDSLLKFEEAYFELTTDITIVELIAKITDAFVNSEKSNSEIRSEIRSVAKLLAAKAIVEWANPRRDRTGREGKGRDGTGRE